jgi:hypothetical protein
MHRQSECLGLASDSRLAEIDDETYGRCLHRHRVPDRLRVTLSGPLRMVLGDPEPAGQPCMWRANVGASAEPRGCWRF